MLLGMDYIYLFIYAFIYLIAGDFILINST